MENLFSKKLPKGYNVGPQQRRGNLSEAKRLMQHDFGQSDLYFKLVDDHLVLVVVALF